MRCSLLLALLLAAAPIASAQSERAPTLAVAAWPACSPAHYLTRLPCAWPAGFGVIEIEAEAASSGAMRYVQATNRLSDPKLVVIPCFESAPMVERMPRLGAKTEPAGPQLDRL